MRPDMTPNTDLIAERIAALPISSTERREALAYVETGEGLAQALLAIAHWFQSSPALKPSPKARLA
jgi:hypothetical protein